MTLLLSSGFATVTHASARIFFVFFHIAVVIVIIKYDGSYWLELNMAPHWWSLIVLLSSSSIFVSFVLEAFYVEYSVEKGDLQTALERRIEELELAVAQYVSVTRAYFVVRRS